MIKIDTNVGTELTTRSEAAETRAVKKKGAEKIPREIEARELLQDGTGLRNRCFAVVFDWFSVFSWFYFSMLLLKLRMPND